MIQKFLILFVVLFSLEAHVSGTQEVSAVVEFVFVQVQVGLKVQVEDNDGGYQENVERMARAKVESKELAQKINKSIIKFQKANKSVQLLKIEKDYQFFKEGMSGYLKFPTLISDVEAKKNLGKPAYFQLSDFPRVIVRFKSIPETEILLNLKNAAKAAILAK